MSYTQQKVMGPAFNVDSNFYVFLIPPKNTKKIVETKTTPKPPKPEFWSKIWSEDSGIMSPYILKI